MRGKKGKRGEVGGCKKDSNVSALVRVKYQGTRERTLKFKMPRPYKENAFSYRENAKVLKRDGWRI